MPARKVHYSQTKTKPGSLKEVSTTLCGKVLKTYGNYDPIEEFDRESFLNWSKDGRCKICDERVKDIYTCSNCDKDFDDCKCTDEDFFGPESEVMK